MANAEQLALLRQGAALWNEWRQRNEGLKPDMAKAHLHRANLFAANLSGADFREADLSWAHLNRADLSRADLRGADLNEAYLRGANFGGADLSVTDLRGAYLYRAHLQANLSGANLSGADLRGANLSKANLRGAILHEANLSGAQLREANLSGASLSETVFGDTNLRDAQGLDACHYGGPSTIDHRTLTKYGPLPLPFLRGCGLPDQFIDYLPSLFNQAIQFYSCFISYSTTDQDFAERLHADLQNKGVRCWFAPHDIRGGQKVHEQIDEAIRVYDRLLLILSPSSMHSRWVKVEIAHARRKELESGNKVLFPVALIPFDAVREWEQFNADIGEDTAREVREYHIPDFGNWTNHDDYQKAFERLRQDLKAGAIGR